MEDARLETLDTHGAGQAAPTALMTDDVIIDRQDATEVDGKSDKVPGGTLASIHADPAPGDIADLLDFPGHSKLFDLGQIDVSWDPDIGTLWAFITPLDRPNYNVGLLRDTMTWQMEARKIFDRRPDTLQYMVLGSRFPGVFNLGGDLEMFARCIENQDREALRQYSHLCVDIVDRVWNCNDMPIINIGLAQGDALGGGFEALMCFDVIVAERQARFGLPEVLFGLFPGMGAYSILARRLGHAVAEKMILSGKVYTAEEMHEMGIVTVLAEPGQGEDVTREYIATNRERHAGQLGVYNAGRRVNPIELSELRDVVDGWVDTAMRLTERDLKMMRRLAAAQTRLHRR